VSGTLGYSGTYQAINQASGALTYLPPVGRIVGQGDVLYRVAEKPVVFLEGTVPMYRDLAVGLTGRDVQQLNAALVAAGYHVDGYLKPDSDRFDWATASAVRALQKHLHVTRTGEVAKSDVVFLGTAEVRVTGHGGQPGGQAAPGLPVLTASSTDRQVTASVEASLQSRLRIVRYGRSAPQDGARHDQPHRAGGAGAERRRGLGERLPQPADPRRQHQRPQGPGDQPATAGDPAYQRRRGELPQRGHRQRADRCAGLDRGPAARDGPPLDHLRPFGQRRGLRRALGAGADREPAEPGPGHGQQPLGGARHPGPTQSALNGLFLGLGAVALLVGGVGVANTMVISVLERWQEIGLRRALGATRGHIRIQFLAEAIMLAGLGGAAGVSGGALATLIYTTARDWAVVIPPRAWIGGVAAAVVIGAIAGLLPALRAARMQPTEALRTV
jgi:peptidoglycan hydrolase-like protein with peptidoglycan-binding domain